MIAFDKFTAACLENKYVTKEQIDQYLENNGSAARIFANSPSLAVEAEAAGIDADGLAAAVERFNTMVENREDEDFGRTITEPLSEDTTYYIVEQKPRFATTLGGLKINDQMQVLNEDGEVIQGLLAAGELAGGLHGDDSMPSVCVSWAFTSGRLAGQQAAGAVSED